MKNRLITVTASQVAGVAIWLVGGTLIADRLFTPNTNKMLKISVKRDDQEGKSTIWWRFFMIVYEFLGFLGFFMQG